ncbi:2-dehydropantoate 2-reductase [Kribbella antiqua]|uniref:2-dehydropantoate 2-reductase n=1 Tax=Kribbella antiqua TaxID=2512217 RepID=A0A4R2IKR7_9ACTN|nr:2-dehydropantoate 2-reductase [Kribbella antiqua]TCO45032.1 2-dehydropantoate 2-reductase [Kribbella antiqua]
MNPGRSVTVIGAGAMGVLFGASLAQSGHRVTICAGRPIDRMELVDGDSAEAFPVHHVMDPADLSPSALVVLAVKAHHTVAVGDWLTAATKDGSPVLVAQNGIEHGDRVRPFVGDAPVIPAVVFAPVERTAPGRAIARRSAGPDLCMPDNPVARRVATLLSEGGLRPRLEADFTTAAWTKLLTNLVSNSITALTGRRTEVVRDPAIACYARELVTEAASVARAAGAAIPEQNALQIVDWLQALPEGSTTSMLTDRTAGRPLEHDAISGAILRAADGHGIETPRIRTLHALLNATSEGLI